jgi:hypothetical protein
LRWISVPPQGMAVGFLLNGFVIVMGSLIYDELFSLIF